ncbi:MAG: iron-containing alcohol dehydrogenase, partial [Paludibacteraceae bacterium]|nr:iron-containing alcohol dehydrogenase [Paludibacteraceae bacterium]
LANRVFGIDSYDYTERERALKLSERLEGFFKKIGVKTKLSELGIDDKDFDTMAKRATRNGTVGHYVPLDAKAFTEILKLAI